MCKKRSMLAVLTAVAVLFSALAGSALTAFAAEGSNEIASLQALGIIDTVKGITQNKTTNEVLVNDGPFASSGALAGIWDGITTTRTNDVGLSSVIDTKYTGVCMTLKVLSYAEKAVLYTGINSHKEALKVYASDSLTDLYEAKNCMTAEDLICDGTAQEVSIKKNIKYMAVIYTGDGTTLRPTEIEIWGYALGNIPTNLLNEDCMVSIKSVQQDKTTDEVTDSTKFNNVLTILTDGTIPTNNSDINNMLCAVDKDPPVAGTYNEGVQIMLDKAYTLSVIRLYLGTSQNPDYVRVYASEKREDLYKETSKLVDDAKATGQLDVEITKNIRHIAVLVTKTTTYNIARVKEFEVYGDAESGTTVDEDLGLDEPSDAVNLIDQIAYVQGIVQYADGEKAGQVELSDSPFGNAAANAIYDGDKGDGKHKDVGNTSTDATNPRYAGVLMTLSAPVVAEKAVLYSGLSGYTDVLKVYASDSLDTLYTDANLMDKDLPCNGAAVTVDLKDKTIQYMAVILTGGSNGGLWRPKEFEIWGEAAATTPAADKAALENAITVIKPAIAAHGATISSNSENNILFKSKFTKVLQRSCGYTLKEYGILIIPEQFITVDHQNYNENAALTYGNSWVVTASYTVADGEVLKANEEFSAELRGSSQGVYPGVKFAYRGYAIYSKEDCEDVILYSDTTVRSVWGVARAIATAILEARDSADGLTAAITYTDTVTQSVAAEDLSKIASEDVYAFICQNVAAVAEVASKQ